MWGGTEHRLRGQVSARCCTPLVRGTTLVRAEGTKKGIENVPLLYRDLFFFQLQFGRRPKVSILKLVAWALWLLLIR